MLDLPPDTAYTLTSRYCDAYFRVPNLFSISIKYLCMFIISSLRPMRTSKEARKSAAYL